MVLAIEASAGTSGEVAKGDIDLAAALGSGMSVDSLRSLIRAGNGYVNVHSKAYPDGEIRGQLVLKP